MSAVCGLSCEGFCSGLRLEGPLQPDTASGGDEAEEQPQSPAQRPPNYLSAMLTYMAQVLTTPLARPGSGYLQPLSSRNTPCSSATAKPLPIPYCVAGWGHLNTKLE